MSRSRQHTTTFRFTALIVVLAFVASLGDLPFGGRIAVAAPLNAVPGHSITVPAGGSATLNVRAIALTPGATLPTGPLTLAQQPLAPDLLRTAVYYGIDWGYADTSPGQVALAAWHLQDGVWRAPDHSIAERISMAAAALQGTPSWLADGRSVLQAAAEGQATLSELALTPLADSPSVGTSTLTVTNGGFGDAVLHLPYGTVFAGPNGSVIVWAAPALPGSQATPSAQPAEPTATSAPAEPSATPSPEPTVSTDPPSIKGGATATPATESTSTPRPKEATATPEPPTATPTPEATATLTPAPTGTPTPEPTLAPARQTQDQPEDSQSPERRQATPPEAPETKEAAGTAEMAVPDAPLPPSGDATATSLAEEEGGAPAPVGTSVAAEAPAAEAPLPQPVGTQPAATIPNPVQTVIGTRPPGEQVPSPVASVQPTRAARQSPIASPTTEQKADPTATTEAKEESPVEQPTPAPTPVPAPPTPVPPTEEGPIINVAPGTGDAAGGTGQPSAGESGTSGMPQTYNPNTGGGQSLIPLWLGLLSAVMVLGGWSLRRVSRPARVRVRTEDDPE